MKSFRPFVFFFFSMLLVTPILWGKKASAAIAPATEEITLEEATQKFPFLATQEFVDGVREIRVASAGGTTRNREGLFFISRTVKRENNGTLTRGWKTTIEKGALRGGADNFAFSATGAATATALVHTHPNESNWLPSPTDIATAERRECNLGNMKVVVIHLRGITIYDPKVKTTYLIGEQNLEPTLAAISKLIQDQGVLASNK